MVRIDIPMPVARPEDILPDGVERATIADVDVRKGTVVAFVRNTRRWLDPETPDEQRDAVALEMSRTIPALRAVSVLDIFEVRDEQLRKLVESTA